jgi:mannose-6-phosphate isomerase-like protein (cupin superfamily)
LTDKDIVLVEADDLIMVADVDQLSDMAAITDHLAATNQTSLLNCIDVHRPWGSFKILAQGSGFLVKQLTVLPEQKISLQSHQCRVENWVVVSGIASVQLDGCESELVSGQSLRVGTKQIHRLLNKQTEVLQVIEVQTGLSLDESDIVRYDDEYLRHLKK